MMMMIVVLPAAMYALAVVMMMIIIMKDEIYVTICPKAVEDCAGSVIRYGWIIATLHIKHYTGRSQVSRGDPAGQGQTGEV